MSKPQAFAEALLNYLFRDTSLGLGANLHVALFTAASSDFGAVTEVTGGSYARVAVARQTTPGWTTAASRTTDNVAAVTFAQATANWGEVVAWGIYSAASAGTLLYGAHMVNSAKAAVAVASTDVFTSPAHGFADTNTVRVFPIAGQSLPTGVVEGTTYFVRDATTDTFKVAATSGGAAIDITANGACRIATTNHKTVNNGDTPSFAVGALDVSED